MSLQKKLVEPARLKEFAISLRKKGKSIATLNGSFDLLHAGHLFMIEEASKQADILLVGLNSDSSIKKYKSPSRPIIPLQYRLAMMAALELVDYVSWFDETDPCAFLTLVQPDVHVNGEEYGPNCIEAKVIEQYGGRLYLVPRIDGLATTQIIEKIKACD